MSDRKERPSEILAAPPPERRRWVREAFHSIAGRYDLLNTVLSGGIHLLWKREAVRAAGLPAGGVAVDVCCGTGDLVALAARAVGPDGRAVGIDFAPGMLAVGAGRLRGAQAGGRAHLVCGDAETLPLATASAHAVSFAFGIRNVAGPARALREAHRVLRPGGRLVLLEFGRPRRPWLRAAYDRYSRVVVPRLGGWLSGRRDAYQYLHDSIRQWVDPDALADLMRAAGFADVGYRFLTGGIAILHIGTRPAQASGPRIPE